MNKRVLFIIFLFLALFIGCWSIFYEPGLLKIRHEKFSWNLEPMKVVFFSDLHAGAPFIDLNYIDHMVQVINEEKPDLILIGGDLVINGVMGGKTIPFERVATSLSRMRSKFGIFAVLGNHDWWNDANLVREQLRKVGIRVLENETITLSFGAHSRFNLIAVGDEMTGHANDKSAFLKIENNLPRIVLLHDPGALLDFSSEEKFDLALAGHLHGGQVNFPWIGPLITPGRAPRFWAQGWTNTDQGKLFVTNGIGTSILPIRFNAPPEVVVIDCILKSP